MFTRLEWILAVICSASLILIVSNFYTTKQFNELHKSVDSLDATESSGYKKVNEQLDIMKHKLDNQ